MRETGGEEQSGSNCEKTGVQEGKPGTVSELGVSDFKIKWEEQDVTWTFAKSTKT